MSSSKVIVLTGASSGIGAVLAKQLGAQASAEIARRYYADVGAFEAGFGQGPRNPTEERKDA